MPRDAAFEAKVREVASSLRCPVCQNNSIEESPSLLAQDMKREVRQRLAAGESPDEVRRYFISRYGEWVLTKPRAAGINLSGLAAAGRGAVWGRRRRVARRAPLGAARRRGPASRAAPSAPSPYARGGARCGGAPRTQGEAAGIPRGVGIGVRRRAARRSRPGDPQAAGRGRARRGERSPQTTEEGDAGCREAAQ